MPAQEWWLGTRALLGVSACCGTPYPLARCTRWRAFLPIPAIGVSKGEPLPIPAVGQFLPSVPKGSVGAVLYEPTPSWVGLSVRGCALRAGAMSRESTPLQACEAHQPSAGHPGEEGEAAHVWVSHQEQKKSCKVARLLGCKVARLLGC